MAKSKTTAKRKRKGGGGRRANYAPTRGETGAWKYLPISWANWLGFALFAFLTLALVAQTIATLADTARYGNDWVPSLFMTAGFATMTYLFATTRTKDY